MTTYMIGLSSYLQTSQGWPIRTLLIEQHYGQILMIIFKSYGKGIWEKALKHMSFTRQITRQTRTDRSE